jgi:serine/threonine protein kinase
MPKHTPKRIPNFDKIEVVKLIKKPDGTVVLPRFTNDHTRIRHEHFQENSSVGKGAYGTGFVSLGVQQVDDNKIPKTDSNGRPELKQETSRGFRRFIKRYQSAREYHLKATKVDIRFSPNYAVHVQKYEDYLLKLAKNTYHNGELAAKALVKDEDTGEYYLVMHAIPGIELEKSISSLDNQPVEKIFIATNMALEVQRIGERGILHDDIKPENFMLDGFLVRLIDFDHSTNLDNNDQAVSTIGTLEFCPDEKLNVASGAKTIVTKKTDVFATVASIIDMLTGTKVAHRFVDKVNAEEANPLNILVQTILTNSYFATNAWNRYLGKDIDIKLFFPFSGTDWGIFENKTFDGIAMSPASYDRIKGLESELFNSANQDLYFLPRHRKNELISLLARGLAIDPNQRPTQEELCETLKKIAAEVKQAYLRERVFKPILNQIAKLKNTFPHFGENESGSYLRSLIKAMKDFSKKELVSNSDILAFEDFSSSLLIEINNRELFTQYLNTVSTKVNSLKEYTQQSSVKVSPDVSILIQALEDNIAAFNSKPTKTKATDFNEFKLKNQRLLGKIDEMITSLPDRLIAGIGMRVLSATFFSHRSPPASMVGEVVSALNNKTINTKCVEINNENRTSRQ